MDVSVVVTCWNGRKLLKKNLPSVIKAAENPKNRVKEILVVDDGSTDDSVEFVKQSAISNRQLAIRLIEHGRNIGYSATCNTGMKEARSDLVVILNLDVVPSLNFLEAALPHFHNEKVFAVSFNEGKFGPGKLIWKDGFLEIEKTEIPKKTEITAWPSGGSSVFNKKIWQELGGMDELFLPFYFEDIDLGIRATKARYECLWEPESKIIHQHEATINPQNFSPKYIDLIKQRNHLLLTWKYIDSLDLLLSHLGNLTKKILFCPGYLKVIFVALLKLNFFYKSKRQEKKNYLLTKEVLKINEKI